MENSINGIQVFENSKFGQLEIRIIDGKEYFPASACAKILGYSNPRKAIIDHCKKDGVTKCDGVSRTTNQHGTTTEQKVIINYIDEGNLYRLITHSNLPQAERFECWIFDEVLPTIRKTGGYVNNEKLFVETYLPYADESTKQLFGTILQVVNEQNQQISILKPKAAYADQVSGTEGLVDVGTYAKLMWNDDTELGRNKMYKFLRDNNILISNEEPYQKYINNGWLKTTQEIVPTRNGYMMNRKVMITGKGQVGISRLLNKKSVA